MKWKYKVGEVNTAPSKDLALMWASPDFRLPASTAPFKIYTIFQTFCINDWNSDRNFD